MTNPISEMDNLLDNIINDNIDFVTPEQIQLMNKTRKAIEKLLQQAERMDRAGLNTAEHKKSLKETSDKVDKFLREYGTR